MMAKVSIFIAQSVWCHISSVEATLPPRGCKIGSVLREWKKKIQHVTCILRHVILDTQYSVLLKFGERSDSEKKKIFFCPERLFKGVKVKNKLRNIDLWQKIDLYNFITSKCNGLCPFHFHSLGVMWFWIKVSFSKCLQVTEPYNSSLLGTSTINWIEHKRKQMICQYKLLEKIEKRLTFI